MSLVNAITELETIWDDLSEDVQGKMKAVLDEAAVLQEQNEHLITNVLATGTILLTGRGEGDPVYDQWAQQFENSPDALPLMAKSVMEEVFRMQLPAAMKAAAAPNGAEESNVKVERALVAFSAETKEAMILCVSGAYLEQQITALETAFMTGLEEDAGELMDLIGYEDDPKAFGLYVYEGTMEWDADTGQIDISQMRWHELRFEELNALMRHERLWKPVYPNGVPESLLSREDDDESDILRPKRVRQDATNIGVGPVDADDDEYEEDEYEDEEDVYEDDEFEEDDELDDDDSDDDDSDDDDDDDDDDGDDTESEPVREASENE
jgi:hypothetical protein